MKIVIFGSGGTGKSTLGKLLSSTFEFRDLFHPYQESITIEKFGLDSNTIGSVIVAPGQERRHGEWDELLRQLVGGKFKLIIHVVSWGYHSFGTFSYKDHPLYRPGMSSAEFATSYATQYRQRELAVLKKLEPHLSIANQEKTVLITLVSKQDLWWNDRLQVQEHYINGDYDHLVQSIRNKRGSNNFIHEYLSASLVMENFVSGAGELLVPTTQGYDQRLQFTNFRYFLNTIESLFGISLNAQEG